MALLEKGGLFALSYYVSLRSEFRVVMSVTIPALKRCSVRLFLQSFVEGLMAYLHYVCLFGYRGVQHILCCVCVCLFGFFCCCCCCFSVLCTLPVSLDCPFFLLTLRFSLRFIYKHFDHAINQNII